MKRDIVIIGGGITGLAAAYSLEKKISEKKFSFDYRLVEKEHRLGGKILTESVDGFIVEGGPDCFISEKPAALKLCHQLSVESSLLPTNEEYRRTYILWKKKLHPLPDGFMLLAPTNITSFLTDSLISPLGKLRVGLDLILPAKRSEIEETLTQFVRRRMGNEVLEKIAEPLVAGVHASNPDTMSLKSTFPRFIEIERQHRSLILGMIKRRKQLEKMRTHEDSRPSYTMFMTLKEGLATLTTTLGNSLTPGTIITGKEVVSIRATGDASGYLLTFNDGTTLPTRTAIVTAPAFIARTLMQEMDPPLAAELSSIPYVSTATVSLAYRQNDIPHPLHGFGFVIPRLEKRNIMASTWTSRKFSHRAPADCHLIRCFVGGAQNEALSLVDTQELVTLVREELRDILGIHADPLFARAYQWEKSMPQYILGHTEKVKRIQDRLQSFPGLFLAGSAYRGIGISDCIVSGEQAATSALTFLERKNFPTQGE